VTDILAFLVRHGEVVLFLYAEEGHHAHPPAGGRARGLAAARVPPRTRCLEL